MVAIVQTPRATRSQKIDEKELRIRFLEEKQRRLEHLLRQLREDQPARDSE